MYFLVDTNISCHGIGARITLLAHTDKQLRDTQQSACPARTHRQTQLDGTH